MTRDTLCLSESYKQMRWDDDGGQELKAAWQRTKQRLSACHRRRRRYKSSTLSARWNVRQLVTRRRDFSSRTFCGQTSAPDIRHGCQITVSEWMQVCVRCRSTSNAWPAAPGRRRRLQCRWRRRLLLQSVRQCVTNQRRRQRITTENHWTSRHYQRGSSAHAILIARRQVGLEVVVSSQWQIQDIQSGRFQGLYLEKGACPPAPSQKILGFYPSKCYSLDCLVHLHTLLNKV